MKVTNVNSDKRIIDNISSKTLFEPLTPQEEEILWKNRVALKDRMELIPLILSVSKKSENELRHFITVLCL